MPVVCPSCKFPYWDKPLNKEKKLVLINEELTQTQEIPKNGNILPEIGK
jgi:hypothetical protein